MGSPHFIFAAAVLAAVVGWAQAGPLLVNTNSGPVQGFKSADHPVNIWWGIPFAAPPVGDLRWKTPVDATPWTEPRDCTQKPPWCPQVKHNETDFMGTEDCLTLDVYAPDNATADSNLPVMFWVHGGSFTRGSSIGDPSIPPISLTIYEGSKLANKHNIVFVSTNYRMDIFGFMALTELQNEDPYKSTGNYGIQDQRKAMQWVKANIANFGGNPDQFLLFGESAGGISVCAHMVSPQSAGLFTAALAESGLCGGRLPYADLAPAVNESNLFVAAIQKRYCNSTQDPTIPDLDCLRSLPTGALLDPRIPGHVMPGAGVPWGVPSFMFMPTIDGSVAGLPDHPLNAAAKGNFHDVPILIGTNRNEGNAFVKTMAGMAGQKIPLDRESFEKTLAMFFTPEHVTEVLSVYNPANFSLWEFAGTNMLTDYFLACPSRAFIRNVHAWRLANNSPNVNRQWLYMFDRKYESIIEPVLGDIHAVELFWVFDFPMPLDIWGTPDKLLSFQMGSYWASMAESGDPNARNANCDGCINWPPHTALVNESSTAGDYNIQFNCPLKLQQALYKGYCDFWDTLGYLNP